MPLTSEIGGVFVRLRQPKVAGRDDLDTEWPKQILDLPEFAFVVAGQDQFLAAREFSHAFLVSAVVTCGAGTGSFSA